MRPSVVQGGCVQKHEPFDMRTTKTATEEAHHLPLTVLVKKNYRPILLLTFVDPSVNKKFGHVGTCIDYCSREFRS